MAIDLPTDDECLEDPMRADKKLDALGVPVFTPDFPDSVHPELTTHQSMYNVLDRADAEDNIGDLVLVVRVLIQDSEAAIVLREHAEAKLMKRIEALERDRGPDANALAYVARVKAAAGALAGQFRHEYGPGDSTSLGMLCAEVEELLKGDHNGATD